MRGEILPAEGIEPTLPKERDFESRASASSATPAQGSLVTLPAPADKSKTSDGGKIPVLPKKTMKLSGLPRVASAE